MSKKKISPEKAEKLDTKTFFDCVLPGIIKEVTPYDEDAYTTRRRKGC